jgi:hypothetical protein
MPTKYGMISYQVDFIEEGKDGEEGKFTLKYEGSAAYEIGF